MSRRARRTPDWKLKQMQQRKYFLTLENPTWLQRNNDWELRTSNNELIACLPNKTEAIRFSQINNHTQPI